MSEPQEQSPEMPPLQPLEHRLAARLAELHARYTLAVRQEEQVQAQAREVARAKEQIMGAIAALEELTAAE